jgi:flagellar hook-associated protein 2
MGDNSVKEEGTNAILTINGQNVVRTSNTINIDGIDLTLNKTTGVGDPPITVNTVSDTSQLMDPVKKFVEDYNTLIESLNKAVKETVYRDFPPLSDTQKEEMSEEQIKKWEEKARSGMLRGTPWLEAWPRNSWKPWRLYPSTECPYPPSASLLRATTKTAN